MRTTTPQNAEDPAQGRVRDGIKEEKQGHRSTIDGQGRDQALAYRGRGWVVVPACTDPCTVPWHDRPCQGKRPLVKIKGRDTVPTVDLVRRWWQRWPLAQVAILTGARSGLVVVDLDGPEGEQALAKLEAALGKLPPTMEVKTKRGRHLYFRHPGGYVLTRKGDDFKTWSDDREPAHGLDVRGEGGLVIARSGVNDLDLAELPESWVGPMSTSATAAADLDDQELEQALEQIRTGGEPCDCMERVLDKHAQHEGGRHAAMIEAQFAIVNLGREGHPGAGDALDRLQDAFLAGKPEGDSEWTRALDGAVASAMATEPEATGCLYAMRNPLDDDPDLAQLLDKAANGELVLAKKQDPAETEDQDDDTTWKPVDLTAVLAGNYEPPLASIGRRSDGVALLYPGREHAVAAEPEAGKTWLLCQITCDELEDDGRVLYIDFEDDEQEIVGRLLTLGAKPDQLGDGSRFKYVRPAEAIATSDAEHKERICRLLDFDGQGPTLVILDGVTEGYGLHGWSIDSNDDSPKWRLAFIKPALRAGAATLASDHVVKNPDNRRGFAIGAQHKKAGLTGALFGLQSITPFGRGLLGRSELIIYKDRRGGLRQYGVRRDDGYVHLADLILDARSEGLVQLNDDGSTDRAGVTFEIRAPEQAADGGQDAAAAKLDAMVKRVSEVLAKRGPMIHRDLRAAVRGQAKQVDEAVQYMITAKLLHEGEQVQGTAKRRHLPGQCREGFKCHGDIFS